MSALKLARRFRSEKECIEFLEKRRWKNGVICPYCKSDKTCKHHSGERQRHQCQSCYKSFSVLVGTIFESTKMPLMKWFTAIAMMIEAKKGISAMQLSRHLDINKNTAWLVAHKIRKAMNDKSLAMFGGVVEMDETYIPTDKDDDNEGGNSKTINNTPVVGIAEKGGRIKAFTTKNITSFTLIRLAKENVREGSLFHTDMNSTYNGFTPFFKRESVKHAVEYVSKKGAHTNTVESFWGLLKRGIKGQFHHISKKYAQNYINEFEFRFNRRGFKSEVIFDEVLENMLGVKVV